VYLTNIKKNRVTQIFNQVKTLEVSSNVQNTCVKHFFFFTLNGMIFFIILGLQRFKCDFIIGKTNNFLFF